MRNNYSNTIRGFIYQILQKIRQTCVFIFTLSLTCLAYSNPVLHNVASGNVNISQSTNTTIVNQASEQAIINWNSFNIAAGQKTQFIQPNASAIALNRIIPGQGTQRASDIFGSLTSNGQIILINGAGIHFGPNATVDVGGLIATTSDISDANFLAGIYNFNIPSALHSSIINKGTIIAENHGLVALLGTNISNTGLIQAELGNVVLGTGSTFTLDFFGDQLVNFSVGNPTKQGGTIKNKGTLLADGGKILVTAQAAENIVDDAINMKGVAQARSVGEQNGEIILSSNANVNVSGTLDASGLAAGETGGTIKVLGKNVNLTKKAVVNTSGNVGGGTIDIGGDAHGAGTDQDALSTTVNAGAVINSNAVTTGNGGNIVVWSNNNTQFHGSINATGGSESGNGGNVETSGGFLDVSGAQINLLAPHGITGTWLLDPGNIIIENNGGNNSDLVTSGTNPVTLAPTGTSTSSIIDVSNLETALQSSNVTVTTTNSGGAGSAAGNITVANAITWSSTNSLSLVAANTISINAGITATSGSLNLTAPAGITLASNINTGTGSQTYTGPVTLGSAVTLTGGAISLAAVSGAGNALTINTSGVSSISGVFSDGNGSGSSLTLAGSGTLTLSGANTYSGGTTISGGTLIATAADALGTGAITIDPVTSASATLDLTALSSLNDGASFTLNSTNAAANLNLSTITLANAISVTGENNTINSTPGSNATLSGSLSGGGALTFNTGTNGSGIVTLSGSNTNYTGNTTIDAGVLNILSTNALGGTGTPLSGGTTTVVNGAQLLLSLTDTTLTNTNTITLSGTGNGEEGAIFLNADNSFSLSNPIILIGSTAIGVFALGSLSGTLTLNNQVSGSGPLTVNAAGTVISGNLVLAGANTYSGSTTVNAGTLNVSNNSGLGTGSVVVDSGATLNLSNVTIGNTLSLAGTGVSGVGALTDASSTVNGNITLTGDTTITTAMGDTLTLNSTINGAGNNLTVNDAGIIIFNGAVSDVNTLLDNGTGTTTLANNISTIGNQTYSNAITLGAPAVLTGVDINLSGATLSELTNNFTINTSGTSLISSEINGSGSITLNANNTLGSLELSGNNTYTGSTTIDAGTLAIANHTSLGNAVATVTLGSTSANATLEDLSVSTDTISNPFTIGGTGNSNIQSNGALTLSNSINGATSNTGQLAISSTGLLTVNNIGANTPLASLTLTGSAITIGSTSTIFETGTGSGHDITISSPLSWSNSDVLTISSGNNIYLNGNISAANGTLNLNAVSGSNVFQSITTGNETSTPNTSTSGLGVTATVNVGTFNLQSGDWYQNASTPIAFNATNFELNGGNGPTNSVQFLRVTAGSGSSYSINDVYGLQGIDSNSTTLGYTFTLSGAIDATGTSGWNNGAGFIPIGTTATPFTGTINGTSNIFTINNLFINDSTDTNVGLVGFAHTSGIVVENLGLTNVSITGSASGSSVGGVAGGIQDHSVGNVIISDVYVTGAVNATAATGQAGGLLGNLNDDFTSVGGILQDSFNTATVTAGSLAGGIVGGIPQGSIQNSYNTGSVFGSLAGGIAGQGCGGCSVDATIQDSYNIGFVHGTSESGGLLGQNNGSTSFINSFFDTQTSGQSAAENDTGNPSGTAAGTFNGSSGLDLTLVNNGSNNGAYSGWSISSAPSSSTWGIISGYSYPYLTAFYSTTSTPSVISGYIPGANINGSSSGDAGTSVSLATGSGTVSALTNSGLTQGYTLSFNNGFYYFLEPNGVVSPGNIVLTSTSNSNGIDLYPSSGAISGLNLTAKQITVGDTGSTSLTALSNTTVADAFLSGVSLYTASGTNITLNMGINLVEAVNVNESYNINGNIIAPSGPAANIILNEGVTLGASTVLLQNASSDGSISLAAINGNGDTLQVDTVGNSTISGILSGSAGTNLSLNPDSGNFTGKLTLTGANSYSGTTTITAGTLQIGNDGATGSLGTGSVIDNGTLIFDLTTSPIVSNNIRGSGTLTQSGTGTVILSGDSDYTGGTNITNGIISLISNSGLGTGAITVFSGAELDLSNNVTINNAINLNGQGTTNKGSLIATGTDTINGSLSVNSTDSNSQIDVANSSDQLTLNGIVTGVNLNKAGAGILVLANGNNNYTGRTNIINGVLTLSNATAIPTTSALTIQSAAEAAFSNVGAMVGSLAGSGTINLESSNLVVGSDNTSTVFSGNIMGTGNFTKIGTGTLTLTGRNTFNGLTDINGGTLNFASNTTLGIVFVASSGALEISNAALTTQSVTLSGSALIATGTSSLTGNVNLLAASTIATLLNTDALTIIGNINGTSALALQGSGAINITGTIGTSSSRLASFSTSSSGTTTLNGGSVMTSGNQTYNNPLTLSADTTLDSLSGLITVNQSITGSSNLTMNSSSGALLNGGTITTTGNQTYNTPVNLGATTTINSGGNVSFLHGISGDNTLQINGTTGNNNITLMGNLAVNNLTVTGSNSGNNTLTVQTNDTIQNWTLTNVNAGNITGISEMTGTFNFGNIQNIVGGNNTNIFTLAGGTLAGSIIGGSGANTLTADNVNNTWNITGTNSGSVTGVNSFNNIQNIVGGSDNNTFNFSDGSRLSGSLNGGGNGTNTLNYASFDPINITLTSDHGGTAQNIAGGFQNINNLIGDGAGTIFIANGSKTNIIHITGALQGFINDPLTFSGFNTLSSLAGVTTQVNFDINASLNVINNTAIVNNAQFNFTNIQNFTGSISAQVNAFQNAAIISSMTVAASTAASNDNANSALQSPTQEENNVNDNLVSITDEINQEDNSNTLLKVTTNCS